LLAAAALAVLAACDLPLGLGLPTIQALNSGAGDSLDAARSFRIAGTYTEGSIPWKIDLELARPSTEHVLLSSNNVSLEAVVTDRGSYFRGRQFLAANLGSDPVSQSLVQAAGDLWWTGFAVPGPVLLDFTKGGGFKATFLGTAVTSRTDHVSIGGVPAVELSGPRGDAFLGEAPPYHVLKVHMHPGAVVDGISGADFTYSDYGRDFAIAVPSGALDFADQSTLPPIYTVVSVDTSACGSPCLVAASLKNLGGKTGTRGPSIVTFTMTDPQTNGVVGACKVAVQPDVGHSSTTTVSCTISGVNGTDHNAAVVTATADNSGLG
jgi:hypothetical protein